MSKALIVLISLSAALNCAVAAEPAGTPLDAGRRRLFLDEFRPQSSLVTPSHPLSRAKFPCVNVHFHPGRLTSAEVDQALAVMDEANIAVSVSLDGRAGPKFAEHVQALAGRHPHRFVAFVRMDYVGEGHADDPATWDVHQPDFGIRMADKLADAVRQGACGLKLPKDLGLTLRDREGTLIAPDDPRFDPVWQRAGELHVPVLWHCGDPVAFFRPLDEHNERWEELARHPEWSFYGPRFPDHQSLIDARNRVIERHPETTFICAHFADLPENLVLLGTYLDRYPNMYTEFGARISELGRQPYTARRFFLDYSDRIMFGTDGVPPLTELVPHFQMLETRDEYFPYADNPFPPQGFWNIYGLGLPDDVLRQVYFENAQRLIPGVQEALRQYARTHPEADTQFKVGLRGPARWEPDIRGFEQDDATAPIPPRGVLFVGSSSIRLWKLDESFPNRGFVNRGFGGCETSDVLHFARRIVIPRRPAVIVLYAGDNDLASGKGSVEVAEDFQRFVDLVAKDLPDARIVYLPVKPSPKRWSLFAKQRASNALAEAICVENPQLEYVDLVAPVLGKDGQPDPSLFIEDGLHLNAKGYQVWTQVLAPVLDRLEAATPGAAKAERSAQP